MYISNRKFKLGRFATLSINKWIFHWYRFRQDHNQYFDNVSMATKTSFGGQTSFISQSKYVHMYEGKRQISSFFIGSLWSLGCLAPCNTYQYIFFIFYITPEGRVLQGPLRLVQLCFLGRRIYKTFTGTKLSYWGPHP